MCTVNLNIHLTYNYINIHVKYAIVLQFLKRVTLHVGVIYHRMDDIVQCLFNLHIKRICIESRWLSKVSLLPMWLHIC